MNSLVARLSFYACLIAACQELELITQYNRLYGAKVGVKELLSPIEKLIDGATDYEMTREKAKYEEFQRFAEWVKDYIWSRLPESALMELAEQMGSTEDGKLLSEGRV